MSLLLGVWVPLGEGKDVQGSRKMTRIRPPKTCAPPLLSLFLPLTHFRRAPQDTHIVAAKVVLNILNCPRYPFFLPAFSRRPSLSCLLRSINNPTIARVWL